jgi:hypothetical protein
MPPPALSLGADARSIHAFSSCLGAGEAGGFLRSTSPLDTEWDAAGWRGRTALAAAVSAQAKTVMTANSIVAAGDATMLTSTV